MNLSPDAPIYPAAAGGSAVRPVLCQSPVQETDGPLLKAGARILVADLLDSTKGNSEVTHFISAATAPRTDFLVLGDRGRSPVDNLSFEEVRKRIAAGVYQAAFIGRPARFWNPRKSLLRNLAQFGRTVAGSGSPFRLGALLRMLKAAEVPLAGVDFSDRPVVDNSRFGLLEASLVYFKRELPLNPANAFLYTTDKTEDTGNIARIPFFVRNLAKLQPAHLGIRDQHFEKLGKYRAAREFDLIFAGSVRNRPLREIGMRVLRRLQEEGYRIVATDRKFSKDEYYNMVARSRLCWSPEGFGFDCYRTYEAAALGCAPVLKTPPIHQSHPHVPGVSALYYRHESADLYDVLKAALEDRGRLDGIGEAARAHTARHHCSTPVAESMLRQLLAVSAAQRGEPESESARGGVRNSNS